MANEQLTAQDALGGAGSIAKQLRAVAVNGISRGLDGLIARELNLGSLDNRQTVNAEGEVKNAGAPQASQSPGRQLADLVNNPIALAIGAAVALSVIVVYAVRK